MDEQFKALLNASPNFLIDSAEQLQQSIASSDHLGTKFILQRLSQTIGWLSQVSVDELPKTQLEIASEESVKAMLDQVDEDLVKKFKEFHLAEGFQPSVGWDYKKMLTMHLAAVHQSEGRNFIDDTPMFGATSIEVKELEKLADDAERLRSEVTGSPYIPNDD